MVEKLNKCCDALLSLGVIHLLCHQFLSHLDPAPVSPSVTRPSSDFRSILRKVAYILTALICPAATLKSKIRKLKDGKHSFFYKTIGYYFLHFRVRIILAISLLSHLVLLFTLDIQTYFAFFDKSTKFGTEIVQPIMNKFGY